VRAFREPLGARARRWTRRHRTLVTALAAVLIFSILFGGGTLVRRAAQQAKSALAVRADLEEATRMQRAEKWSDAHAALERAEGRLGDGGPEELRERVATARAELSMVARLDKIRQVRSAISNDTLELETAAAATEYANAFRDFGLDVHGEVPAVAEAVRQSAIKGQLLAALDDWAEHAPDAQLRAHLLAVACRADPDPWRDRFRNPELRNNVLALRRLAAEAPLDTLSPIVLEALVNRLERAGIENLTMLRRIQARYPHDYFLNFAMAARLDTQARQLGWPAADVVWDEAIGFARAMLAARPDSATAWSDLGGLLFDRGRMKEAEAAQRKAVALQPDNARFYMLHSAPLRELGRLDEAEQAVRTAISLKPDYGNAYSLLANILLRQKRIPETEDACRKAIELKASTPYPLVFLAQIARGRGKTDEAEALEREAERIRPGCVSEVQSRPWEIQNRLEAKLPEWLRGKAQPADALELTVLGSMAAHRQGSYDATAQLFANTFAKKPQFAEATVEFTSDRPRYLAACCAAQASLGHGDGSKLDLQARTQRRQQSLEWLRQELAYWDKQMADQRPAAHIRTYKALSYWLEDGWMVGVRDASVTDKLAPAEREACRTLWNDVAVVLKRARAGINGSGQAGPKHYLGPQRQKLGACFPICHGTVASG
jgi:tetratricopeptide (TPR) repeat protein